MKNCFKTLLLLIGLLIIPASVSLAATSTGTNSKIISLPITAIKASSTYIMKGENRHAFSFEAQAGTTISTLIKNKNGTVVKNMITNKAWSGGRMVVLWDGKTNKGTYVSSGDYIVIAEASNSKGTFTKTLKFKVIDKMAPSIKITSPTQYFSPLVKEKTVIFFELNKKAQVTAAVYDKSGAKIQTLLSGNSLNPGKQQVSWNGKNTKGLLVKDGKYQIVLTSVADNKLAGSKKQTTILIDSVKPSPTINLSSMIFKMGGGNEITGEWKVKEKVNSNAYIVDHSGNKVKDIAINTVHKPGTVSLNWDGSNEKNQSSPEGAYRYAIELTDLAGNKGVVYSSEFILQDWIMPKMTGESHVDFIGGTGIGVSIPYKVTKDGTVTVQILKNGKILDEAVSNRSVAAGENVFVWNGKGATDGNYSYMIIFKDKYGQRVDFTGEITVTQSKVAIDYPDRVQLSAGYKRVVVNYELSLAATVTIDIYDLKGYRQKQVMKDAALSKGIQSFTWNGVNDSGLTSPGDEFVYVITAKSQFGNDTIVQGLATNKEYPSWLISFAVNFYPNEKGAVKSINIGMDTTRDAKVHLKVFTSATSAYPVESVDYNVAKGLNVVTYTKPTTDPLYYQIAFEDRLGNLYTYKIAEN